MESRGDSQTPGRIAVRLLPAGPARLSHPFGSGEFYRHGWHSWCPTGWVDLAQPPVPVKPRERWPQACDPAHALSEVHGGSAVGAVRRLGGGDCLLLGSLGADARVECDGAEIRGLCEGEPVPWVVARGPFLEALDAYAGHLAGRFGRSRRRTGPVWCSWYGYYRDLSEDRLRGALAGLEGLPFEVFQVDDGWQRALGDWEPNDRFPSGMADLARRIRSTGRVPGLWLAPFLVHPDARLFRERPEWLLRSESGGAVSAGPYFDREVYCLDVTRPEVGDWLADLVRRVVSWGFGYLKLDFLYAAALPGVRFQEAPRERSYRRILGRLREAAGEAWLLACGAPVIPSLGLVDGLRVGPDVAGVWDDPDRRVGQADASGPSGLNALSTSLQRLWLSPLVQTDPDVVYFRSRENGLDQVRKGILQDLARVAGFRATSDPPEWLEPSERQALGAFLSEEVRVVRLDETRFDLGGRVVDLAP